MKRERALSLNFSLLLSTNKLPPCWTTLGTNAGAVVFKELVLGDILPSVVCNGVAILTPKVPLVLLTTNMNFI